MKPIVLTNLCSGIRDAVASRTRMLIIIMVGAMIAMTSCHSHRHVVRGDQGTERVHGGKKAGKDSGKHSGGHTGTPSTKPPHTDDQYVNALLDEAYAWLGVPYLYGGKTRKGTDCSGFVFAVFDEALGIKLPRVSREQGEHCKEIKKSELKPGDLVFFCTGKDKHRVSHVGIYVGDNNMIHASSKVGICIAPIDSRYFTETYHHSGRVEELVALRKKKRR